MRCHHFLLLLCSFHPSVAKAQRPQYPLLVDQPLRGHFPALQIPGRPSIVPGDIDRDGAEDVFIGDVLFANDGFGRYQADAIQRWPASAGPVGALADVDGDGDLDAISLGGELYLNAGDGTFRIQANALPATRPATVLAVLPVDIDADGDLDLLIAGVGPRSWPPEPAQTRLWENLGASFVDRTATHIPQRPLVGGSLAAGDFDGDGDLDLVLGHGRFRELSGEGANHLYRNDGSGHFQDISSHLPQHQDVTTGIAIGDLDADGDLDLALSNDVSLFPQPGVTPSSLDRIYLNDGAAGFVDLPLSRRPSTGRSLDVEILDLDGDQDLDVVFTGPGEIAVYENLGGGQQGLGFVEGTRGRFRTEPPATTALAALDANGDGDPDILCAGVLSDQPSAGARIEGPATVSQLLLGAGTEPLRNMTAEDRILALPGSTRAVRSADVDRDGLTDLILARQGGADQVLLGDGSGSFFRAVPIAAATADTHAIDLGDIDGDGRLDLVAATAQGERLLFGDGRGGFRDVTAGNLPSASNEDVTAVLLADLDGDGDLDLLSSAQAGRLFENLGAGRFADRSSLLPTLRTPIDGFDVADFDADGDTDVVVAAGGGRDTGGFPIRTGDVLLLNGGGLTFSVGTDFGLSHMSVCARDLDLDGYPDLVFSAAPVSHRDPPEYLTDIRIWINDGTAGFRDETSARIHAGTGGVSVGGRHLEFADLDRDGDQDIVCTRSSSSIFDQPHAVLLDDGTGHYSLDPQTLTRGEPNGGSAFHLVDVDQDGDQDLVAATGFFDGVSGLHRVDRIYLNPTRQLIQCVDTVPGSDLALVIEARSPRGASSTALVWISGRTFAHPVVLPTVGVLQVDPTAGTPFLRSIRASVGRAEVRIPLPPVQTLVGVTYAAQGLIVDDSWPGDITLSAVVHGRVRR